ncbi:TonB-dependent receptor domain-containing protein [Dyella telluris]|uniref:TonB-dependent receptor n=1 Tax=Dyella telluris TaxID=2763498 RepID=A0A7G8Q8A8_9GAMM|nr:TonB-dependent receptor [Dyella telluris]QNK03016.1 TonB-dependent receptor [Dyella telluris]
MQKKMISAAVLAVLMLNSAQALAASMSGGMQETPATQDGLSNQSKKAKSLDTVTVTGSLIPQSQVETATPVFTITGDQMKAQGFTSVAQALQASSFATGSVQGNSTSASFTQGAETMSIFGLDPGYVKYLIDGRPMGNFPALYNGSGAFNNLTSIPAAMVDHIDILPGGQSSLYGSDAIAGVVNIVLKKKVDAPVVDVRYGWYGDGGGSDRRIYLADSFTAGKFNITTGLQYENVSPIWGTDRDLTKQFYTNGTSPAVASRDFLVNSSTKVRNSYVDPNKLVPGACGSTTGLFGGTEGYQYRKNSGNYCGSFDSPGYRTLKNDKEIANLYTHATFDATDNLQLYGDLLYNYDQEKYATGSSYTWWGTSADFGAFYDPNLKDLVNLQRGFAPEEVGGYNSIMNKTIENSYMLTLGGKGVIGESNWDYDINFTHSDDHLNERKFARWTDSIDGYFEDRVLGPQLGTFKGYPIYAPNYSAFYQPVPVSDFRGFTGYTTTNSKTWDNIIRGQVTNTSAFKVGGGDAGVALALEGGNQGWDYSPDARLMDGGVWGTTAVQGAGHRSRFAGTAELSMPLLKELVMDTSLRYDNYSVSGKHVDHTTYNVGLEYRPIESLLLRGKYGSAFKMPTLPDEYQGMSGYYNTVTDYYNCAQAGYAGANIGNCPNKYYNSQFFGQKSGNTALKPITATVWNYGFVWSPITNMSWSVDYYHFDIRNEVDQQDADVLSQQEYLCRSGAIDINSASCQQALSQIVRLPQTTPEFLGDISTIYTPKVNVARERLNALTSSFQYLWKLGSYGALALNASYSDILRHDRQPYPGDPMIDLLRNPYYSTDFKTKVNASATWSINKWSTTLYANRYGSTPNYLASTLNNYTSEGTGKLAPWFQYNASVTYNAMDSLALSFVVNNLFNTMPPEDDSYPGTSGSPYNGTNYNVYGRSFYVQATYKFGKTH